MSDLTLTWAEVHACLAAKYGKRAFDALNDLLYATIGSDVPDLAATAADEIVRLRAVLDAIDALHQPVIDSEWLVKRCEQCDMEWPCRTHLLLHPTTLDEAIDTLGTVHK